MKRLVGGLLLLVFYALGLLGNLLRIALSGASSVDEWAVFFTAAGYGLFLFVVPGSLLALFGYRSSIGLERRVVSEASAMIAESGRVDLDAFARRLDIGRLEARTILAKVQAKGELPRDVQLFDDRSQPKPTLQQPALPTSNAAKPATQMPTTRERGSEHAIILCGLAQFILTDISRPVLNERMLGSELAFGLGIQNASQVDELFSAGKTETMDFLKQKQIVTLEWCACGDPASHKRADAAQLGR